MMLQLMWVHTMYIKCKHCDAQTGGLEATAHVEGKHDLDYATLVCV